ncbi:CLUMA_CG008453, isoform A [Clunio marinus]|uniref:CLUMA_CG008453, isoform A n=1 Tax=Clunio marinus TaxID=568069 RepID=A0A1J1I3U4_9DIPT|nr:CLUMA_CG008453, isoform A [Clunio marinus]
MSDVCRLCGDLKSYHELQDIYDSESDIIMKLENTLKVKFEFNKMLPNSVCCECVNNLERCSQFAELISSVQVKLKLDLQEQLQMIVPNDELLNYSHDIEFKSLEIKIEKLDPDILEQLTARRRSTRIRKSVVPLDNSKNTQKIRSKKNPKIKRTFFRKPLKNAEKFQMHNLFKNELEGRFVVQPQDMDIGDHQPSEGGVLPDALLEKFKGISWKNYEWKCEECQESFENGIDLEKHSLKHHKKRVIRDCCAITYLTHARYICHINEKHQPELKYCCLICSEYRTSFLHLYQHMKSSHPNYKFYYCLYCGEYLNSGTMLFRHIDDKHLPLPLSYHCDICGESFSTKDKIWKHVILFHMRRREFLNKKKSFMCEICALNFKTITTLKNHQDALHGDKPNIVCPHCGKEFKLQKKLRIHIRRIHDFQESLVTCEICGKSVKSFYYKAHMRAHTDEKPFKCKFCPREFKYFSGCRYHVRAAHTGERPYRCPVEGCNQVFIDFPNSSKHIKTSHGLKDVKPIRIKTSVKLIYLPSHKHLIKKISMSVCRLCGDLKSYHELQDIYDSESDIIMKLENTLKVELEFNKMLPNSVCWECVNNLERCSQFSELISSVQVKLKLDLQEQLQMIVPNDELLNYSHDIEFKSLEIKIEKLDPDILEQLTARRRSTRIRKSVVPLDNSKNTQKIRSKKNPKIKRTFFRKPLKNAEKFQMHNLFKNELEGRFVVQPQDMDIGDHQPSEGGVLPDALLEKFKGISWKNYEWKCEECQESFENGIDLEKHSLKHHKKRVIRDCCAITYLTHARYIYHINEKHQPELKYCCLICSEYRTSFLHLYQHMKSSHPNYKFYYCLYCGEYLNSGTMLFRHIDDKHLPLPLSYHCDICGESFSTKDKIWKHVILFHMRRREFLNKKKSFMCEICALNFKTITTLKNHQDALHGDKPNIVCPHCGKEFKLQKKLRIHIRRIHDFQESLVTCEICGKSVKSFYYKAHMRAHTDEKPFKCKFCPREFKYFSGCRYHVRAAHTGERPYRCPVEGCNQVFIDFPNSSKHIKTSHGLKDVKPIRIKKLDPDILEQLTARRRSTRIRKSVVPLDNSKNTQKIRSKKKTRIIKSKKNVLILNGDKPYKVCPHCGKAFKLQAQLRIHKRRIHGFQKTSVTCEICGNSVRNYKTHMMIHTGENPFKCKFCPREFKHSSGYEYHVRAEHTGERPYRCPVKGCNRVFIDSRNSSKHIKASHGLKDVKPIRIENPKKKYKSHKEIPITFEIPLKVSEKFQTYILFKNELEGRFVVQPQDMDIGDHQANEEGVLPDVMLEKLKGITWQNYEWKCEECEENFENVVDVEKHSLKHHKKRVVRDCCLETYKTYPKYIFHITEKHQPELKYCCLICSEYRTSFLHLYQHMKSSHPNHNFYFCLYCGQYFVGGTILYNHIHTKHILLPLSYQCDLCGKHFSVKNQLWGHMTNHVTSKNPKSFMCEICALSFRSIFTLQSHQKRHLEQSEQSCPYCGKLFGNRFLALSHIKRVHGTRIKETCEICGKVLSNNRFKRHMDVHTGENPFKCKFCPREFRHSSGFIYHVRAEHTGERPYRCPVEGCNQVFIDYSNSSKHIKTFHGLKDVKPIRIETSVKLIYLPSHKLSIKKISMSVCRLCGGLKSYDELQDIYDSESDIIIKLENTLKVELEFNKMLPNSVCWECVNNLERCIQFAELISSVQIKLKLDLQEQLQMIVSNDELLNYSHDIEFKSLEIKIEKLDPDIFEQLHGGRQSTKTKKSVVSSDNSNNTQKIKTKKNPKKKQESCKEKPLKNSEKYQMHIVFKNELEGRFVVQPQDMDIGGYQPNEDGVLPDAMLEKLKGITWKNYEWKCEECEENFENVVDVEKHGLKHHKMRVVRDCCLKTYKNYPKYVFHIIEKHQPELKYCCLICSEYRTSFLHLYQHMKSSHPNHNFYFCLYCGHFFCRGTTLDDHVHTKHIVLPLSYQCDLCGKHFSVKNLLTSHMFYHFYRNNPKSYLCEICALNFKSVNSLHCHQRVHHKPSEIACPNCGKLFSNRVSVKTHIRRVHGNRKKIKVTCEICGKTLMKNRFKRHMDVHTGENPFKCKFCPREFKHSSGFIYHVRAEHTGERPYRCPVEGCNQVFIDYPNSSKHIKTSHGLNDVKPIYEKSLMLND